MNRRARTAPVSLDNTKEPRRQRCRRSAANLLGEHMSGDQIAKTSERVERLTDLDLIVANIESSCLRREADEGNKGHCLEKPAVPG